MVVAVSLGAHAGFSFTGSWPTSSSRQRSSSWIPCLTLSCLHRRRCRASIVAAVAEGLQQRTTCNLPTQSNSAMEAQARQEEEAAQQQQHAGGVAMGTLLPMHDRFLMTKPEPTVDDVLCIPGTCVQREMRLASGRWEEKKR
jgi:hypothetical protein